MSRDQDARSATAARIERVLESADNLSAVRAMRLLASLPDDWIHEKLARKVMARFGTDDSLAPADQLRIALAWL